jgi:hypothetical protein
MQAVGALANAVRGAARRQLVQAVPDHRTLNTQALVQAALELRYLMNRMREL